MTDYALTLKTIVLSILWLCTLGNLTLNAQVVIFSDTGTYTNEGTNCQTITCANICAPSDLPMVTNFGPIDVSGCTSFEITFDFSSDEWVNSGNLETPSECTSGGGCAGDINNPTAGGCCNCWDYLYFQFDIDGSEEFTFLLGQDGQSTVGGNVSETFCTNDGMNASMQFTTQTWGDGETIEFSNIMLICNEPVNLITALPGETLCPNEQLDLSIPGGYGGVNWLDPSLSNIGSGNSTSILTPQSGTYTVQATDGNGCAVEDDVLITVLTPPTLGFVGPIAACNSDLQDYDLTTLNSMVGSGTVVWYDGDPNAGGTPITPATNVDLTTIGLDLWVELTDGTPPCSNSAQIIINDLGQPPAIYTGGTLFCETNDLILEANNGDNTLSYDWFHPMTGTTSMSNPWVITNITSMNSGTYELTVTDNTTSCTTTLTQTITVLGAPLINVTMNGMSTTTLDVCVGEDVTMMENGGNGVMWEWTNSAGTVLNNTDTYIITNAQLSDSDVYTVEITTIDNCTNTLDVTLNVLPGPILNSASIDGCSTELVSWDLDTDTNPDIYGGGATFTWYDADPSLGGANMITPTNAADLSGYAGGSIWVEVTDLATMCSSIISVPVTSTPGPTGCISGDLDVCEDGCANFTFDITGGSGNYSADIQLNFLGFPLGPFTLPATSVNSSFKICFDPDITTPVINGTDVILPVCDPLGIFCLSEGDMISLELLSISDNNGCPGIVMPSPCIQTITFHENPDANPFTLSGCGVDFQNYNLDGNHASDVNNMVGPDDISWWDSQPSLGGATEYNGSDADLSTATSLWAQVTDPITGCISEVEIPLVFTTAPTVTVAGGATLCIGECTDNTESFTFTITGGVGPFDVYFTVTAADGTSTNFYYNNISGGSGTFIVCIDDINNPFEICNPVDGCPTPVITFDSEPVGNNRIFITSVIDDGSDGVLGNGPPAGGAGCNGLIGNPNFANYLVAPDPDLTMIPDLELCAFGGSATVDLTQYEAQINQTGLTYSFTWFDNCNSLISNPSSFFVNGSAFVCYEVETQDGCIGDGSFDITIEEETNYDNINTVTLCLADGDGYTLPAIMGSAVSANTAYYTASGGGGTMYVPGDQIFATTTLYVFDPNSPNCSDEVFFDVIISNIPEFIEPIDGQTYSACNSFTLPIIVADFVEPGANVGYFEGSGGTGLMYSAGTAITTSTQLYVFIDNGIPGCETEILIDITITDEITFGQPAIDPDNCGCVTLPPITNGTTTVMYYTMPNGLGTSYSVGDQICDIGQLTLYVYDAVSDQSCITTPLPEVTFTINPGITLDTYTDVVACEDYELPAITGTNITNPVFNTQLDGSGTTYMPGDLITTSTTLYAIDQIGTCDPVNTSLNITIETPPLAGTNSNYIFCQGYSDIVDITSPALTGDLCGNWSTGSAIDISDPLALDLSNLSIGTYTLEYECLSVACPPVLTTVMIDIVEAPFIDGSDEPAILCQSSDTPFDLFMLLNDYSQSNVIGEWSQVTVAVPSLGMGQSSIIPSDYNPGTYEFAYTLTTGSFSICEPLSDTVTVQILAEIDAGPDVEGIGACSGDIVDLSQFVGAGGTFADDDMTGNLIGSDFSTSGLNDGLYTFTYSIPGVGACPGDEALLTVDLTSNLSAGIDTTTNYCSGAQISLFEALSSDANSGGNFLDASGNPVDPSNFVVSGPSTFTYEVGGVGSCALETAEVMIDALPIPALSGMPMQTELCDLACTDFMINASNGNQFYYTFEVTGPTGIPITVFNISSGNGPNILFQICNSTDPTSYANGVLNLNQNDETSYQLIINQFSNDECPGQIGQTWNFDLFGNTSRTIAGAYCPEDNFSITIEGQTFDITNQDGMITKPNPNGSCDSTIIVDLFFFEPGEYVLNTSTCEGQAVLVGDEMIADDDLDGTESGMVILENASQFGCDSTINYTIAYTDAALGIPITDSYCEGEVITINGKDYDFMNPAGMDTIPNGSVGGCDSINTINLTFLSNPTFGLSSEICLGDTLFVGQEAFYEGNENGDVILENAAANGCDSTVNVSITFSLTPERTQFFSICQGESIIIYDQVFDENTLTGQAIVESTNGECDSLIRIEGTLLLSGTNLISQPLCESDELQVGGDIYDVNTPSGETTLIGAAANGCDSLVTVDLDILFNSSGMYLDTLCGNDEVIINGTPYSMSNPNGQELLEGASSNGCDSLVTIEIVSDFDFDYSLITPCPGDDFGNIIIENIIGGSEEYTLAFNGQSVAFLENDLPFTIQYPTGQPIELSLTDQITGCEAIVANGPAITVGNTVAADITAVDLGSNEYQLTVATDVDPINAYGWSIENGDLSCIDCPNPIASLSAESAVFLEISYGDGCLLLDTLLLSFDVQDIIFVPNIFNPSGNDADLSKFFVQSTNPNDIVLKMSIYDRWGNLVFQESETPVNDPTYGWDGTMNGEEVQLGVYVYVVEILGSDGDMSVEAGDLTLVR